MEGYNLKGTWNMDENGCFFKALLTKGLAKKGKQTNGGKRSREVDKLIVIWKSKSPRQFRQANATTETLQVSYFSKPKFVLARIAENRGASEIVSTVDIVQAIQWVFNSWNEVSSETIMNCFAKYGIVGETTECSDEINVDFAQLFNELAKDMNNIDDQMALEGNANFDLCKP